MQNHFAYQVLDVFHKTFGSFASLVTISVFILGLYKRKEVIRFFSLLQRTHVAMTFQTLNEKIRSLQLKASDKTPDAKAIKRDIPAILVCLRNLAKDKEFEKNVSPIILKFEAIQAADNRKIDVLVGNAEAAITEVHLLAQEMARGVHNV